MTPEERAQRLVGDMPWVTERLTEAQKADLPKQIAASMGVAVVQEREEIAAFIEQTIAPNDGPEIAALIRARKTA